jgi:hypothetical protein
LVYMFPDCNFSSARQVFPGFLSYD